jgi:hypothetical protein
MKSLCEAKRNKIISVTSRLVKLQGCDQREEPNQFFWEFFPCSSGGKSFSLEPVCKIVWNQSQLFCLVANVNVQVQVPMLFLLLFWLNNSGFGLISALNVEVWKQIRHYCRIRSANSCSLAGARWHPHWEGTSHPWWNKILIQFGPSRRFLVQGFPKGCSLGDRSDPPRELN